MSVWPSASASRTRTSIASPFSAWTRTRARAGLQLALSGTWSVVDLDRLLVGEEELEARDALLASLSSSAAAFGTDRSLTAMWNPTSMTGGFLLSFSRQLSRTWKNVSPLYWMQKSNYARRPPQAAATVPDEVVAGRQPLVVRVEMSVGIDEAGQDQFSCRVDLDVRFTRQIGPDERDAVSLDEDVGLVVISRRYHPAAPDQDRRGMLVAIYHDARFPSVDPEHGAGHVGGCRGCEEQHCICDVRARAKPSQRDAASLIVVQVVGVAFFLLLRLGHGALDRRR